MKNSVETLPIFLRWAGGKKWLIPHLENIIGDTKFNNYHEPFLGSGAIYFAISSDKNAYLSDLNEELINTFLVVKNFPLRLFATLSFFKNSKEFYYYIRNKEYKNPIFQAARFIFLNQTSYNGLYRVNKLGKYNVPYGNRKNINIKLEKIVEASKKLKNTEISFGNFDVNKDLIKANDLVFLDPPYTVSHNNNGFIEYNKNLFSLNDQYRLKDFIEYISEKGAYYILTNAAHETIYSIFSKNAKVIELKRNSLIGGKNAKREKIAEYIFTNINREVKL